MPQGNTGSQISLIMLLLRLRHPTLQTIPWSTCDVKSAGILPVFSCVADNRRILASSPSFLTHEPPKQTYIHNKASYAQIASTLRGQANSLLPAECAHFFLEPQDWMQQTIAQGELDGKLECPKCHSKVGTYAWQGMRCSCGKWVTPSFALGKSKVDEVRRVQVPPANTIVTRPMSAGRDAVKSRV